MAKLCSYCGAALWRDDARFCPHCGSFIGSCAQSSKSTSAPSTGGVLPVEREVLLLDSKKKISSPQETRELLPLLDVGDDTPPRQFAVISPLSKHNVSSSDNYQDSPALRRERVVRMERAIPVSEGLGSIPVPEESNDISVSEGLGSIPVSEEPSDILVSEDLGSIPVSEDPDLIDVPENMLTRLTQSSPEEVEQQDLTIAPMLSVLTDQEHKSPSDGISVQETVQSSSPRLISRRRSRFSLWIAVLFVALVIVGGIGWLLFSQLASNTDPWQSFSDAKLGFSIRYPVDWQVQVDDKQSIVHFHDSTQTGEVDITVFAGTSTNNVAQFLQHQASQLGMTNVMTVLPRSFANTSWQQVQGKLSQEGVNYTVTMLATIHDNHLYLLTQRSPQSTYSDEEALIFSVMRAGLRLS